MDSPRIVVLGSANMDLVVRLPRAPRPGETVFGTSFDTVPGGKGLNQAVAAARAGGAVEFVGAVGRDAFGEALLALLAREGIAASGTARVDLPTGTAHITVDDAAQNGIVVVPGANARVGVEALESVRATNGWLVTQLEVPLPVVAAGLAWARRAGFRSVLTPAPVVALEDELLAAVDLLVPNHIEACELAGVGDDPQQAAARLSRRCGDVVVTLGAEGSLWVRDGQVRHRQPAIPVDAVDTTAAGDTYVGVLVTRLAEGASMPEAMRWASAAAAISVTRAGASPSMPARAEIESVLPG